MDPQREDRDNPLDRKARNIVGAHWLEEPGHSYTTWSSAWVSDDLIDLDMAHRRLLGVIRTFESELRT